jgi:hypothetical protein
MKNVLPLVVVFIAVSAVTSLPIMAAPQDGRSTHAGTTNQTTRANAHADCIRQANEMMYGGYIIQRRNFLRDCMMEHGFR